MDWHAVHYIDGASLSLTGVAFSMAQAVGSTQMFDKQVVQRTPTAKIERFINRLGGYLHHVLARERSSEPPRYLLRRPF